MKKMLIALLMISLCFAAGEWLPIAGMALMASIVLLAAIFAIGYGLNINEMQILAKEELFQVIAAAILIVALVGTDGILDAISTNPAFTDGSGSLQQSAINSLSQTRNEVIGIFRAIDSIDRSTSIQGSKMDSCTMTGIGYSISSCGGYTMLGTPLSMAGNIAGFALGELGAMLKLLSISQAFAMVLILPLGIILRTFKVTRGAGGFLIAFAISLHILMPIGIVFTDMLFATFMNNPAAAQYQSASGVTDYSLADFVVSTITGFIKGSTDDLDCKPADTKDSWVVSFASFAPTKLAGFINQEGAVQKVENFITGDSSEEKSVRVYYRLRQNLRSFLPIMLIKATLAPVIALLLLATGIRTLTSLGGAEIDVSAISRFI